MASPASSSLSSSVKSVHFDSDCVIIPSSRPQPRIVSKTFSVPLWRSASDKEPAQLRIRVPSITTGRPRVPSRDARPSPSCLASPHAHHRERSDPVPSPTEELSVYPIPIRGRGRSSSTPASSPAVIVPLRGCCAECMPTVDAALCDDYEEKWTRGARRRRRSSSSASESGPAPLGSRISIDLVRVDELPASAVDADDSFSDDLFPLPCGKRKGSTRNPALLSCGGDDDSGSGSGSLTPQSSDEMQAPPTPGLTPTSELDELPLAPRTPPPPLVIQMSQPIMVPVIKEPRISPPSSPSSPVRTRLLSASATFIRGTIAAAASATPGASVGIR